MVAHQHVGVALDVVLADPEGQDAVEPLPVDAAPSKIDRRLFPRAVMWCSWPKAWPLRSLWNGVSSRRHSHTNRPQKAS